MLFTQNTAGLYHITNSKGLWSVGHE